PAATGPAPGKVWGTGSTPSARRRASLARLSSAVRSSATARMLRGAAGGYLASILVILSLRAGPRGTGTDTSSPRFLPSRAFPTGDSFESLFSAGLASAEPTILHLTDLSVFWSLTWTVTPTETTSVVTSLSSLTVADRSLSSSSAISFPSL